MKRIIYIIALCMLASTIFAQQYTTFECGTPDGAGMDRLIQNIQNINSLESRGVQYLPVTMTLLAQDDGSNRIDEASALDAFCALNKNFANIGIQFYLHTQGGLRYVDNSNYYFIGKDGSSNPAGIKIPNTINIFVSEVFNGGPGAGSCSGILGFYSPFGDYVAIDKCTVDSESFALTHELGHFFSLQHTFFGWESEDYDNNKPTPTTVGNNNTPVEFADGRNCAIAADRICDTPPDYGFGLGWSTCDYTPDAFDPDGEPVDPDEENYMGYFFNCAQHHFSAMQGEVMAADIEDRTFTSGSPNTASVTAQPVLTSPINGTISPPQNTVLTWDAAADASMYLVEINRLPNFSPSFTAHKSVATTNSLTVSDLIPNTTHYWRVRPFNEHYTCTDFTEGASFKTDEATAITPIEAVESFDIYPNPANRNEAITLEINTLDPFNADITLYDIQGRTVLNFQQYFGTGTNLAELRTANATAGTYILKVSSENGVLCKKVVIGD